MTISERRLHDVLAGDDSGRPSPDLFARVLDGIDADRVRRRRHRRTALAWLLALGVAAATLLITTPKKNGRLVMDWWILELITIAVLVGMALWLGPFIKRFGRAYAADVFHDNPSTGKSYIVLTDIVYYLIFTAYILFTIRFEPPYAFIDHVTAEQVRNSAVRIGGILLIIGVLHGLNIVLMPVLGRLFSLNRHLSGRRE